LLAADSSVVDNMKAQVSELGEKLPIAEEVTTAAEQMEFAITVAKRKSKVLAEEIMTKHAVKVTCIQREKVRNQ
jgi:hypothetical protein